MVPLLLAVALAAALPRILSATQFLHYYPYPLILPELVVALAASIWCFATDERALLHEAHELGIVARAAIQALVTQLAILALWFHFCLPIFGLVEVTKACLAALPSVLLLFMPAWVETRTRAVGGGWRGDVRAWLLLFVTAVVANAGMWAMAPYARSMLETPSLERALKASVENASHLLEVSSLLQLASFGMIFLGAGLARIHQARPRVVLLAALLAGLFVLLVRSLIEPKPVHDQIHFLIPDAIALSLGPAFADKLVRKIEKRLPGGHADTH